jgi:hypothetical protein
LLSFVTRNESRLLLLTREMDSGMSDTGEPAAVLLRRMLLVGGGGSGLHDHVSFTLPIEKNGTI